MRLSQRAAAVGRFLKDFRSQEGASIAVGIGAAVGITCMAFGPAIAAHENATIASAEWQQAARMECVGEIAAQASRQQIIDNPPALVNGRYGIVLSETFVEEAALAPCVAQKAEDMRMTGSKAPLTLGPAMLVVALAGAAFGTVGVIRRRNREDAQPAPAV